jgi:hypothetical protein
MVFLP